jgi:RNA polymerase sigma-70 factor (ECF subfamily)
MSETPSDPRTAPDAAASTAPGSAPDAPPKAREAFLRLFLRSEPRLYAYLYTLVQNRADADDLLQEAGITMWEKFDPGHPPDDFTAWGCRIAYFKVLDHRKRHARSRVTFSQDILDRIAETAAEQASALQLDERREALSDCIGRLKPRERELLSRRMGEGDGIEAAAEAVGCTVAAAYKSLSRIRRMLFECVTRKVAAAGAGTGVGPSAGEDLP